MITKERLEELIGQCATIYTKYGGYISEINLHNKYDYVTDNYLFEADMVAGEVGYRKYPFNMLFETKEEAEWYKEFGCIERTERFEPLYYDNIDQNYCYEYRFSTKNNHEYTIRVSGKDIILFWTNCNYKEYFKNTKEEYDKLIRRCAKMFLEGDYAN